MESKEELDKIKKNLEEEREGITEERKDFEIEKERYVKMALRKEENIAEKMEELEEVRKNLERSVEEDKIISNMRKIMISALRKDSKFMINIMKDSDMSKGELKDLKDYILGHAADEG